MTHQSRLWRRTCKARGCLRGSRAKTGFVWTISKVTWANLNGVVNDPQISCNTAAKKEIKGCRFHSKRREGQHTSASERVIKAETSWMRTQAFTYTSLLAGSFDRKRWYQGLCRNTQTQLCMIIFLSVFFSHLSCVIPLVLLKSVSINLLQVAFEFVLQWVDQQNVTGLLIQQLGGPRDRRQDRHQAGHAAIVKLLH